MKKMIKIILDNDPEKYIYIPDGKGGSCIPTGAEKVYLEEQMALLKAVAKEEFHLREKAARIKLQEEVALLGNKKPPKITTLFEAFIDPEKHQRMMNYLVSKQLLEEHTHLFKDYSKGSLQMAIDLLNTLQAKGYFHRRLSNIEQKYILTRSFGLSVSTDHIKRPPSPVGCMMNIPPYNITIPIASTW